MAALILGQVAAQAAGGFLWVYSASRPSAVTDPASTPLIGEIQLGSPAFDVPVDNVMPFLPIVSGDALVAAAPTWFRLVEADHSTIICDGLVAVDGDLQSTLSMLTVGLSLDLLGASLTLVNL